MQKPRKGECSYRKSPWRFLFGATAFVSGGWLLLYGALQLYGGRLLDSAASFGEAATIGIIGGADGPTAVFVTGRTGFPDLDVILVAAILIVSILAWLRLCRCKQK